MIDLQQEMEESMERKKQEQEEMIKDDILKLNNEPTHQRKKNQQDVIFNSDIYNSIIKQSQDLYSILFGIDKNNDEKESSIINLTEIVKLIDDSSKVGVNYNNVIEVPKVNYTNNKKKTTNSSLLTKQSTINSSNIHKKVRKLENFYKKNNDILIGLKKCMNEKKSITSNSLLSNRENKNELLNNRKKSVPFSKLILSKEKPVNKDDNKQKKIKINVNNQNYINFLKDKLSKISSKYCTINQGINENKKTILTERESNHYRYKTLHSENSNKYRIYDLVLENNYNKNNDNKQVKGVSRSKILMDIGYYTRTHSKNSSVHKNKRYSTNSTNTIICETERRPSRVIKFYNKQKDKNLQVNNNNNLISFNLKEIRELMREKNMKEKICQTERGSNLNSYKMNKKISFKPNKAKNNLFKNISSFKTTNPSIDNKSKINKNILFSHKKTPGLKSIRKTLPTTPIMNEKSRINRTKIFKMCQEKKLILNLESNNINKTMDKENNHDTEGKERNNELLFTQNKPFNTLSAIKGIKIKNFSTSINFGKANNNSIINKKKINLIINKTKPTTSRNRKQKNKSDEKDLKIKNYKRIISKDTSPNKFQNVVSSNGTEKKKTYLIMKSDFKPYMKADEKFKNKLKNKAL